MIEARDDGELVAAAVGGDRAALDQLLRRHADRLHAVCRRITGNDADALDAIDGTADFTFTPKEGRAVLLWITRLGADSRVEVPEIAVER